MTGPSYSDLYQGQLDSFNATRNLFWQSILGRGQPYPQSPQHGADRAWDTSRPATSWQDDDLMGAAKFWGIPDEAARAMPREQLVSILNDYRSKARPVDDFAAQTVMSQVAAVPAEFALGAAQAVTRGLTNLPIVGEALKKVQTLHDANQYLSQLEEGVRASTPESQQWLNKSANVGGNIAALWYPASGAWALAGSAGRLSSALAESKFLMGAWQGGASAYLLEGNSDLMKEYPGLMMGGGALLGGAFEHLMPLAAKALEGLSTKVSKAYIPEWLLQGAHPVDNWPAYIERDMLGPETMSINTNIVSEQEKFLVQAANAGDESASAALAQLRAARGSRQGYQITPNIKTGGIDINVADDLSVAMNKASTVIGSPDFAKAAAQTQLDDIAVAKAALSGNPGGTNVIQGIADPMEFISSLGENVRFAQRGKRLDAIISADPITDEMVGQYENFGVYAGQKVLTSDGLEGTISMFKDGQAVVMQNGAPRLVNPSKLMPSLSSGPLPVDAEPLWSAFRNFADGKVAETTQAMGGGMSEAQSQTLRIQNTAGWANDFLDGLGVQGPNRERIMSYFDRRYVDEFRALAPVETAQQQIATANYQRTVESTVKPSVQALDEAAATKGFVAIPEGNSWTLRDLNGGSQAASLKFDSMEAAESWLRKTDRKLPDITPPSDVPLELAGILKREATQGANTNEPAIVKAEESLAELADGNAGSGVGGPPPAVLVQDGNVGRLRNAWTDGFLRWNPARRLFSKIDEAMHSAGLPTGIAADYDGMSAAVTQHHNSMHPYMDELTDMTRTIRTNRLVNGEWGRFWMAGADREMLARQAGLPEVEIAAFSKFDDLLNKVGGDAESVRKYFSQIATKQSDPKLVGEAFEGFQHTPATEPFYAHQKTGNLNLREFDPRHVGEGYIRSIFWQKDMDPMFSAISQKWQTLSKTDELKPAANIMKNWLDIIRYGYHAEDDIALDLMHGGLRGILGPEVTRAQARELFNFGLNSTHSGLLGFRLHVMARDALQMFLALPRAGGDLASVMSRWMTGGEGARSAIWNEALDSGAIALQSPRMAAPGSFTGELEASSAGVSSREFGWRMRTAAKVTAAVRDLTPSWVRDTRDSALHPMYFYGKQSELMRALTYTAGKEKALRALAGFRQTGDMAELMGASGARTYDPSWQRQFQQIVGTGDDNAAARFLGRQLADATQFKYGVTESPWAAKSVTGRTVMQMGNYSMQYFQYLRESLANGNLTDKAKFLLTAGTVTAGLEAASQETGWNFRWMNPFFGLGFVGGPWVGLAADVARSASGAMRTAQGQPASDQVMAAGGQAITTGLNNLNPVGGITRTVQGLGQASESPYPGRAIGRLFVTGEMGPGPDVNQQLMPQATEEFQRSLQANPSPVSATQIGLPPGVFPAQPLTYPQMIQGPSGPPWASGVSPQVPQPGGAPYGMRPSQQDSVPQADSTFIPSVYNPQPYTASGYRPEDVMAALSGDQQALSMFAPDEQQFLAQNRQNPYALRDFKFMMADKVQAQAANPNSQGQQAPRSYGRAFAGSGAQQ